jgi:phosphoribosylformylglycinamidine (FGAM) synthase-like enzyme
VATPKPAPLTDIPESTDIAADLLKLMASPAIASRRWIWEQYDSQVGADTVQTGGDAAIVRIHGTKRGLAMTTDCTPRYCFADPVEGGKQAVAEAYRNLCAVGARPLAVTNCLNFGNPQRPEIMGQIVGCLEGMSEACIALDMPIVSGNVSLYNETKNEDGTGSAILPTPAIGAVGVIEDVGKAVGIGFKQRGQAIWLVGSSTLATDLGQSLWLRELHGRAEGPPPATDLQRERASGNFIRRLIASGIVDAVHDVSDGGMLVAITEMALAGKMGAEVSLDAADPTTTSLMAAQFGEDQGRYIVVTPRPTALRDLANEAGVKATVIGSTGYFSNHDQCEGIYCEASEAFASLNDLRAAHEGFLPRLMGADGALA